MKIRDFLLYTSPVVSHPRVLQLPRSRAYRREVDRRSRTGPSYGRRTRVGGEQDSNCMNKFPTVIYINLIPMCGHNEIVNYEKVLDQSFNHSLWSLLGQERRSRTTSDTNARALTMEPRTWPADTPATLYEINPRINLSYENLRYDNQHHD